MEILCVCVCVYVGNRIWKKGWVGFHAAYVPARQQKGVFAGWTSHMDDASPLSCSTTIPNLLSHSERLRKRMGRALILRFTTETQGC